MNTPTTHTLSTASFVEAACKQIAIKVNSFGRLDAMLCTYKVGFCGSKIQVDRNTTTSGSAIDLSMVNGFNVVTYKQMEMPDIRGCARVFFSVGNLEPDLNDVEQIILGFDGPSRNNRAAARASPLSPPLPQRP